MKQPNTHFRYWLFLALLLTAIFHSLAWSRFPTDVDTINFTLALDNFDPSIDSPHPPGYPLFVYSARLASNIFGKVHAYQAVNLAMLLGTGVLLYRIFERIGKPEIGFAAGVLVLTHPLAWAATTIPESYISDAFFACLIANLGLIPELSKYRSWTAGFLVFLMLALVRPVSGVLLLPLAFAATFYTRRSWGFSVVYCGVAGLAILVAYAITAELAGGFETYRQAAARVMGGSFKSASILGGAPLDAHIKMVMRLAAWWFFLVLPAIILVAYTAFKAKRTVVSRNLLEPLLVGLAWMLPALGFYAAIYYLKPTYQLIYLPCLLIPVACCLLGQESVFSRRQAWGILAVLAAIQLAVFILPTAKFPQAVFRQSQGYIRQQDRAWKELQEKLAAFPHKDTLLIWGNHPSLSLYATRLLHGFPVAASFDERNGRLNYVEPKTMAWLPAGESPDSIPSKYQAVIWVGQQDGQALIRYFDLSGGQDRRVDRIAKLGGDSYGDSASTK